MNTNAGIGVLLHSSEREPGQNQRDRVQYVGL